MNDLRGLVYSRFKTQTECAKALGWNKQKLSRIVNGETMITLDDAEQLANVLHVGIEDLTQKILMK